MSIFLKQRCIQIYKYQSICFQSKHKFMGILHTQKHSKKPGIPAHPKLNTRGINLCWTPGTKPLNIWPLQIPHPAAIDSTRYWRDDYESITPPGSAEERLPRWRESQIIKCFKTQWIWHAFKIASIESLPLGRGALGRESPFTHFSWLPV